MTTRRRLPPVWRLGIAAGVVTLAAGGVVLVGAQPETAPSIEVTGEEEALTVAWEAPADDDPNPAYSRFDGWAALWPRAGAVVHADQRGVAAYTPDEGELLWEFTPEGRGLCAAAETPAGEEGDIGVVLVEEDDVDNEYGIYGNACRTVVALDLESGEEVWTAQVGSPWAGIGEEAGRMPDATGAGVWADGPRVVVQRAEILVGLDADKEGREMWREEDPLFSGDRCSMTEQYLLPRGTGELAVQGACDERWRVGVLDTGTGGLSGRSDAPERGPRFCREIRS
ncbi:PQQ-binding-like beta-propeller repeat protein [Nocardiopsis sp. RSe5-2]|uniref:PQQ-binding-like beta-propeller repeat protein n=1 Tax=Nocardiopsis endophytica TaxID=3018445 RepID=A0ABT4U1B3_9ACTN|nr:PQQ-binding-like beta-propeller repeat protein [Nocardiopsis endophytica]MDA2810471.1 PQQ-binding-like beta-propeller repeat protein [Nocardiopsis endophytica]